jgi:hyperosmotically inducible protein
MNNNLVSKVAVGVAAGLVLLLPDTGNAADNSNSSESRIEAIIETRYSLNEILSRYNLDADVKGSLVTLNGKVSTPVEKELADTLAKDVDGVTSITNNIIVDENVKAQETKSFAQKVADVSTTARVKSRFLWSRGVPAMSINVDTVNDVVALKGAVDSESEKKLAEKLAKSTKGVRRVENKLLVKSSAETKNAGTDRETVNRGADNSRAKLGTINLDKVSNNAGEAIEGAGETLSDAWIATKATASLSFTRDLHVDDLGVKTNNGVVVLTGKAYSDADKELAAEIVKDVKGVKSVVNQIQVD